MTGRPAPRAIRVSRGRAIAGTAALGAVALLAGCASRVAPRVPATPAQAAAVLPKWQAFRDGILALPPAERFYDVRASRSMFSQSFVVAVRDDPGRSLLVVVEGPLGVAVARASWDGGRMLVERLDSPARERGGAHEETLASFGVPLPAKAVSTLLVGIPEVSPPEGVEMDGRRTWLSWDGGRVACQIEPSMARPVRAVFRQGRRRVEIRFAEWRAGMPSRIAIEISGGGRADLVLRPPEGES